MYPAKLTARQKHVLAAIVDYYIAKAEPVSSKFLSLNTPLQASSATVRNTMAELEELGFLEQPHTSAGRLPTDWGYRIYVDQIIQPAFLTLQEKKTIEEELKVPEDGELLTHAASTLGRFSQLLGVAVTPALDKGRFKSFTVVPISEQKILVVLLVSDAIIQSVLSHPGEQISIFRLEAIAKRISEGLAGKSVAFLDDFFEEKINTAASDEEKLIFSYFKRSIMKLLEAERAGRIQISGSDQMLSQPDFMKFESLRGVLELLGSQFTLVHFLRNRGNTNGVNITIGGEHVEGDRFKSVSTISASFDVGERQGILGVIGPKRMPYSKIISLVDFAAKTLSKNYRTD